MKKTVTIILISFFMLIAATITGFTWKSKHVANNVNIAAKDIPEYGLHLITPSNPAYENLATRLTHNQQNLTFDLLKPFSVFVTNDGKRTVVAYALKWELMKADGKVITLIKDNTTLWRLMGLNGPDKDGFIIKTGSTLFATPTTIEVTQDENIDVTNNPEVKTYLENLNVEMAQYVSITVTLDGVFFSDGTFVGPDSTGFFDRVKSTRDAKLDFLLNIKNGLQQGKSTEQVFEQIETVAKQPEIKGGPRLTPTEHYNKAMKEETKALLRMKNIVGSSKALNTALQSIGTQYPELRKL